MSLVVPQPQQVVRITPYIRWSANGYRLPTGAEYEYVARYEDGTNYTRGDAPSGWKDDNPANATVDQAERNAYSWNNINSASNTQPVGLLLPNALGFYDLSGNVFELSNDWNAAYADGSPFTDADSPGAATGTSRDVRGGGFSGEFGTAARGTTTPQSPASDRGFRVVRRP
jgi:formylglycine-generating enzyme required for sulfatase activity